jgi:hypothetical protein
MHQSDMHFTFEHTILSGFRIIIVKSLGNTSFSHRQYFSGKATLIVRSVHNTYTSTRNLQLHLIKINHKDSMCDSLRKWNAQFHYRLWTIQYLKWQGLWTKSLCDDPIIHNIDHIQCDPWAFYMQNIHNYY